MFKNIVPSMDTYPGFALAALLSEDVFAFKRCPFGKAV